jgi:uncharacterized protein YdhG (YjbR/CyaY superfamily)
MPEALRLIGGRNEIALISGATRLEENAMKKSATPITSDVDGYIAGFPADTRALLERLRAAIRKAAPDSEEVMSYGMPAYKFHGMLVFFAGYKNHIGFYPTPSGIAAFKKELAAFKSSKGAVQFPLDRPLPLKLVAGIVSFRTKENLAKEMAKPKGKTKATVKAKPISKAKPKAKTSGKK